MHTVQGERILVMAATNRPDELDDAALRYGYSIHSVAMTIHRSDAVATYFQWIGYVLVLQPSSAVLMKVRGTKCLDQSTYCLYWAIPFNVHTPPTDDMVCLSQGVIQTIIVLGGTVSYFVISRGINSTVLGGKLLR